MSRRIVCLIVLTLFTGMEASDCAGQIVRRIRERRAALLAPPVDPNAEAAPADAEAIPPVVPPVRGGFFARRLQMRRDLVAQQAAEAQPTPAAPTATSPALLPQQQTVQKPTGLGPRRAMQALQQASAVAAPALRALTQADMARMEVPALQTALSNTTGELSNELTRYSSAQSWQNFFTLPGSVVDEGTIDLAALQTALVRFENVAANPKFAQISALPSFDQARSLLTELVNRVEEPDADGPQLIDPTGQRELSAESEQLEETLPAPVPQRPMNRGEHSILVRGSKG